MTTKLKPKLYILKALKQAGYIQDQNVVVRAVSENHARSIQSFASGNTSWDDPNYASCEELKPAGDFGVIIVDNNGS